MADAATTLADYRAATRALLRDADPSNPGVSTTDLDAFINAAIRRRDILSRALRVLISFPLAAQQYTYTMSGLASAGTVIFGPAAASINLVDLISVTMKLDTSAGTDNGIRRPLGRQPYSLLAPLLSTTFATGYPRWFTVYGARSAAAAGGVVVVAPPPAAAYPVEWDFFAVNKKLSLVTDEDLLGYPYTEPIPWIAAGRAKVQQQRYDEAQAMYAMALSNTQFALAGARPMAVANPWSDLAGLR